MIDRVDGVTINNERRSATRLTAAGTDGRVGFRRSEGRHTLDGQEALAFVRSRKGTGGSDFSRARRQQQLMLALGRTMTDPAMNPNLPGILADASSPVRTNLPQARLGEMLGLAEVLDDQNVERVVLGPPYAERIPLAEANGVYMLRLDMDALADLSVEIFGDDSRYAST